VREHDHAVGEVHRLVDVVRDEQDRDAVLVADASTRSSRSPRVCASTDANGSSMSRIDGWYASARAIATRCCMPPESCHG
jgi:hypothetical protein